MPKDDGKLFDIQSMITDSLLKCGYPKESIVSEWETGTRRFADYAILDVDTGLPMMIIEAKSCNNNTYKAAADLAFKNSKRYYEKNDTPIKTVAAILNKEEKSLNFIDFTEAIKDNSLDQAIYNYTLPAYDTLTTGAKRKAINRQKKKQKKNITFLKILCWLILPLICLTLVLLDAFGIYKLSTLRLLTVGAGAVVMLIPCFKEIKIGEILLKNQIENQKEDEK